MHVAPCWSWARGRLEDEGEAKSRSKVLSQLEHNVFDYHAEWKNIKTKKKNNNKCAEGEEEEE